MSVNLNSTNWRARDVQHWHQLFPRVTIAHHHQSKQDNGLRCSPSEPFHRVLANQGKLHVELLCMLILEKIGIVGVCVRLTQHARRS